MARPFLARLAAVALALGASPDRVAVPVDRAEPAPVTTRTATDTWRGYRRHILPVSGRIAVVVDPEVTAEGAPWIWRATFWGFSPDLDLALLAAGFHLCFIETEDMYGSPRALAAWDDFYAHAVRERGLSKRPVLEAISRGGLYAYRWAEAHPDQVSAILGDAPVCDFRSWPAGKGAGTKSESDWRALQREYGFASEEEALRFAENPVDRLEALARAQVPLITVYGDADTTVPPAENTLLLAERYRALGGRIELFPKKGVGHVHGIPDMPRVVALVRGAALAPRDASAPP